MKKFLSLIIAISAAFGFVACRSVDDDRIPPVEVYIPFQNQAEWTVYGVSGACTAKRFIKQEHIPSGYPYQAMSSTGYGGVLLCSDIHGAPVAYDLSCPVEVRPDVRIVVDEDLQKAVCPKCHSIYDIFTNYGAPVGGPAAEEGFGLARYRVGPGVQGQYMVVVR